jgi:hypothetical protein
VSASRGNHYGEDDNDEEFEDFAYDLWGPIPVWDDNDGEHRYLPIHDEDDE